MVQNRKNSEKENIITIYEKLKADFPDEAYSTDSSRGFDLTSLKAQYVVERLNEVMGIDGWKLVGEYRVPAPDNEDKNGVLFFGKLILDFKNVGLSKTHEIDGIGYSAQKKNIGDMYKGARTDCLSKTCSVIGIGNEAFKGNISPHTVQEEDVTV